MSASITKYYEAYTMREIHFMSPKKVRVVVPKETRVMVNPLNHKIYYAQYEIQATKNAYQVTN